MSHASDLPKTLPYYLAERIQHGIIRGRYPSGSNLREMDLGVEYGSSRGPIRECLRLLELQGLVVHTPRRGFRVNGYDREEVEQLYRLRARLESIVIDTLADKDTAALAADLDRINEAMRQAAEEDDLDKYFELNVEFHQLMIDCCKSNVLSRVLSIVNDMSLPLRYMLASRRFPRLYDYKYHKRIANAVRRRNFDLARQLTEEHILDNIPKILALCA